MTHQSGYLPDAFRSDVQELKRSHHLIDEVSRTFERFVVDRRWPYELEENKVVPPPADSQSTSAMILFALAAAAGKIKRDSPLLPAGVPGDIVSFKPPAWELFEQAWNYLVEDTTRETAYRWGTNQSHVSWSSSFGWDDPFTLAWLFELDRCASFTTGVVSPLHSALLNRATQRVEDAFVFSNGQKDRSEGLFLTWQPASDLPDRQKQAITAAGKSRTGNNSLDHAFPLLRFVHLREALRLAGQDLATSEEAVTRSMQARVHEQLSKAEIADGTFDASELVFALEGSCASNPARSADHYWSVHSLSLSAVKTKAHTGERSSPS